MFIHQANELSSSQFEMLSESAIQLKDRPNLVIIKSPDADGYDVFHVASLIDCDLSLEDAVATVEGLSENKPVKKALKDV